MALNVYAVGSTSFHEFQAAVVLRLSGADGTPDWGAQVWDGRFWSFRRVAVRGTGVLAFGNADDDPLVDRLEPYQFDAATGALDWTYEYGGATQSGALGTDMALAQDGSIFVCGDDHRGFEGTADDIFVQKLTFGTTWIDGVRVAHADPIPEGIRVSWETHASSRFLGFHLDRTDSPSEPFIRLTDQLILAGEVCFR